MKLKLDENLGVRGTALLRAAGHDVATVALEKLCSASDGRLIEVCRQEQRGLITLDLDFSNPLLFRPADYAGIAVLRPGGAALHSELHAAIQDPDRRAGAERASRQTLDRAARPHPRIHARRHRSRSGMIRVPRPTEKFVRSSNAA